MALGIDDPSAGGAGYGILSLDTAGLVSIAMQRCGDVMEFLGEVFLVADVVCPANKGLVDRRLYLGVVEGRAVEVCLCGCVCGRQYGLGCRPPFWTPQHQEMKCCHFFLVPW